MNKHLFRLFALSAVCAAPALVSAHTSVYTIDPVHSGLQFKIRHAITKMPGNFSAFEGEIHFHDEHPEDSKVKVTVRPESVDTNNIDRDEHLRSDEGFHSDKYPKATFESTSWEKTGENTFKVIGDLTLMGKTHPVELKAEYLGEGETRAGTIIGWSVTGKLDRRDWGFDVWTPIVGTEVELQIDLQAVKTEDHDHDHDHDHEDDA